MLQAQGQTEKSIAPQFVQLWCDREIEQIARQDPAAIRLQQVSGIGPPAASALSAPVCHRADDRLWRGATVVFVLPWLASTREGLGGRGSCDQNLP